MGYMDMVELLLAHPNIDVNKPRKDGATPLISSCEFAREEVALTLIKHPSVDVNAKSAFFQPIIFLFHFTNISEFVMPAQWVLQSYG